jgi:hypothetical protein
MKQIDLIFRLKCADIVWRGELIEMETSFGIEKIKNSTPINFNQSNSTHRENAR